MIPENPFKKGKNYWCEIVDQLENKRGEGIDPLELRARLLIGALGLPSGPYSAVFPESERKGVERARIVAEYLTNQPGVMIIDKRGQPTGVISHDFRDIYPDGLPSHLKSVLPEPVFRMIETKYRQREEILKDPEGAKGFNTTDRPVHLLVLPGEIYLFLHGTSHDIEWYKNHLSSLAQFNRWAKVICVEGRTDFPLGQSLQEYWSKEKGEIFGFEIPYGDHILMRETVRAGFSGLFGEIDPRDTSKIAMDHDYFSNTIVFPDLPPLFFQRFFEYLQREAPHFASAIGDPKNLKELLRNQSTSPAGFLSFGANVFHRGVLYHPGLYVDWDEEKGKIQDFLYFFPTSFEIGQLMFADALSAIRVFLIARLMKDGKIDKGPIVVYYGFGHLPTLTFFLHYPQYAMEVVLRTINELMAGRVERGRISQIYQHLLQPDWPAVIEEICRLPFAKARNISSPLEPVEIDFLKEYGIDPQRIMPSDEEIEKMRKKISGESR